MHPVRWPLALSLFLLALGFPALAAAADAPAGTGVGFPASLPLKDRIEIMQAAGYQITPDGRSVTVYCGDREVRQQPVVGSLDLTGDGKLDYLVMGTIDCPGEPPVPIKSDIVARRPDGIWQNILAVKGAPKPAEGSTDGWRNLTVTKGTQALSYVHDPVTQRYSLVSTIQARRNFALADRPTRPAANALPTAGWAVPYAMGSIPPGDLAAILIAAGYKRVGGKWKGCDGLSDVELFEDDQFDGAAPIMDLNGDGQPEVMVADSSTECYGIAGTHFNIVTPVPGGWSLILESGEGFPVVQDSRNAAGWRDVVAGGPGFCHGLYRHDGKAYAAFRQVEETKGACSW